MTLSGDWAETSSSSAFVGQKIKYMRFLKV